MPRSGVKGNSGGKKGRSGRKPKAVEQDVIKLLDAAWPEADRVRAIQAMALAANGGDVKAFSALMAYRFGKPIEKHEITDRDGESLLQPLVSAIEKVYGAIS